MVCKKKIPLLPNIFSSRHYDFWAPIAYEMFSPTMPAGIFFPDLSSGDFAFNKNALLPGRKRERFFPRTAVEDSPRKVMSDR